MNSWIIRKSWRRHIH